MSIVGINHINITVPLELLEKVRDFYINTLGFTVGNRPGFVSKGFWLYAGQDALIHLTACREDDARAGGKSALSFLDHVAFSHDGRCDEVVKRMEGLNIPYELVEVPDVGQTQIFIRDPAGVVIELNFENKS